MLMKYIDNFRFVAEQMLKPGEEVVKTVQSLEAAGRTDDPAVFTK